MFDSPSHQSMFQLARGVYLHRSGLAAAFALLLFVFAPASFGAIPGILSNQGRVQVSGIDFTGSGQFKFALVNTNGTATFWSNDGSSTAGSQPTVAVTLAVTKGLYSVLLGDTNLTNMTAIPASVFSNSDVRLRIYFNDGTTGFQQLSPDQRIVSVGYAMIANSVADGSVTSASINSGSAAANTILKANGNGGVSFSTVTGLDSAGAGPAGAVVVDSSGQVGIGTSTPGAKLDVSGDIRIQTTTRYYTISNHDFNPENPGTLGTIYKNAGDDTWGRYIPLQGATFDAGVHLPHGAVITGIQAVLAVDSGSCTVIFGRGPLLNNVPENIQVFSFTAGNNNVLSATLSNTIDNQNFSYFVKITGSSFFKNIRFTYTINQPLP